MIKAAPQPGKTWLEHRNLTRAVPQPGKTRLEHRNLACTVPQPDKTRFERRKHSLIDRILRCLIRFPLSLLAMGNPA